MAGLASVSRLQRDADHESRLQHFKDDEEMRRQNAAAVEAGVCVLCWEPDRNRFKASDPK